jgi:hypothetical protein
MATLKPAKDKTKHNLVHTEIAKETKTPSEAHSLQVAKKQPAS